MARPLLGRQQLVASWDPSTDDIEMVGMVPGPAGVASLEFDDLTVDIDVANPASVAFVSIPEASDAARRGRLERLLTVLIGPDSTGAVLAMTEPAEPDRVIVGGGDWSAPTGPDAQVRPDVAALAIALTQATAPGLRPVEQALALLEGVGLAGRAELLSFMTWLTDEIPHAVDALEGADADELPPAGSELSSQAAEICAESAAHIPSARDRGRVLAFAQRVGERTADASAPPRRRRRDSRNTDLAEVSPESLTAVTGAPDLEFRHVEADEFEARVPLWAHRADGWWVRVFAADGLTPVAMAPLTADGKDAVAELLVPQPHQDHLQVDVVEDPLEPKLSVEAAAFRVAIVNGQRAARYERLGRRNEAVEAWRQSEEWHRRAGDETRARQADAIARQQSARSMPRSAGGRRPVITDHLFQARRERST